MLALTRAKPWTLLRSGAQPPSDQLIQLWAGIVNILLVSPYPKNSFRHQNIHLPQLSLAILAGLTPPEHEVEIVEEPWDTINFDKSYDLVGITTMTATASRAYEIAAVFSARGVKTILGGIHPTTLPNEAIQYADSVVIGEAENVWANAVNDLKNNKLKRFYKDEFPILESAVIPRRDLIKRRSGRIKIAPIETTRGCPYNCDFCSVTKFFGPRLRHKPIEDIMKDISTIDEKNLLFLDDNIVGDGKYARELFGELKHMRKKWVGQSAINIVKNRELLRLAADSGCCGLFIGLESISAKGMSRYKKNLKTKKEISDAIKILQDLGILMLPSIIFGFDSDEPSIFKETVEFLIKCNVAFAQFVLLTPFPGTKIFADLEREGRIVSYDWDQYDMLKLVFKPSNMTSTQLLEGIDWVTNRFYSLPSIIRRVWANKCHPIFYLSVNWGFRASASVQGKLDRYGVEI